MKNIIPTHIFSLRKTVKYVCFRNYPIQYNNMSQINKNY